MKKYAVLLVVFLFPRISTAHTRLTMSSGQNPKWASMPVPYWIEEKGLPGISNGSDFAAVQASFQTWQNIPTASIQFAYKGTTAAGTVGLDGMNLVTFTDTTTPLGTSVIAATFSFFKTENGTLLFDESDIALNPALTFSTGAETGKFDIQSVLTHEIGHFLGLDHSALISSVMVPFGVPSQLDQRTLTYDDIAGVMEIYPNLSAMPRTGQIQGTIQSSAGAVFGAHVVAVDSSGTAVASTLSQEDGTYTLQFLPPDTYRIAVEPLDGPVTVQNIGGTNGFYGSGNTTFGTTYSGNVATLAEAASLDVGSGQTATADIKILPASSSGLNLTRPAFAIRIPAGQASTLSGVIGGIDLSSGVVFSASDPGIQFGAVTFGGRISSTAPSSVSVSITILPTTAPGPKILAVNRGTDASIAAGAFVITDTPPSSISVLPSNGAVEGGTPVTIKGTGFRPGAQVYFAGSVCANIQVVDSKTITATTPVNDPGLTNIVVVNMDGTWGAGQQLFTYIAQPPTISAISPLSGPPGTEVVIQGDHFDSRTENIDVQFNGTSARVITAGANAITAVVPFSATSGPVSVTIFGQAAAGPVFTVGGSPISTNFAGPTFNFIDASAANGGTAPTFGNNDDAIALVDLPFDFVLFKDIYPAGSRISVAVNGYLSLETLSVDEFQNTSLPSKTVTRTGAAAGSFGTVPPSLIAPFWEDLVLHPNSAITTKTLGARPNRQFVVEWSNLSILNEFGADQNASLTFEAVLYEGSNDVQFLCRSVSGPRSNGSNATVGMQNFKRDTAVQTGFNQAIISNGYFTTYHFQNGTYSDSLPALTAPVEVKVIPSAPQDGSKFTGLALIAQAAMTVSLSAFDNSGKLVNGAGIHNPTTITLAANQEYIKLVSELFGLQSFDGWIETDASAAGLSIFLASGSLDMRHLDGAAVTDLSADFLLFHAGASAILVNPSPRTANVTLSVLGSGTTQSIAIGPRSRFVITITGITRVQSSEALSGIERLPGAGGLTSNAAIPFSQAQTDIVFPDAVVGAGYSSILTIANTAATRQTVAVSLGTASTTLSIDPNTVVRTSISDLLHIPQGPVIAGAVRVNAGSAPIFGLLDIVDSNDTAIMPARSAGSNFTLPNVANGNGFFTGLALASGSESANITIEVHDADGNLAGSATINLTADQQLSLLLSELVPAAANQMSGYILIRSDHPIWVWEIFGSSQAIASAPPL